uniref:BCL2 binding component 3 n=1 Tax=Scleropages formosus TaxID=113540 RepID=A0A8C9W7R5_SCLFO
MARPQTNSGIESSQQGAQQSCRMEVLQPEAWRRSTFRSLHQAYQPCRHRPVTDTLSSLMLLCSPTEPAPNVTPSDINDNLVTNRAGSGGENRPNIRVARGQQPLEDHQAPVGEHQDNSPRDAELNWEDEVSERVAYQLRIIGDEMNAIFQRRRNAVLPWQNWMVVCRGLFVFITNTLCILYQQRHR